MERSAEYSSFVEQIKSEFPSFEVITKENSLWMKIIYAVTFMRLWNRYFMETYVTIMFGKVYMPQRFIGTRVGYEILRHEYVHLRDARRWPILFELSYLFFPLPFVFTLRAYWEYRAYCETLIVEHERLGYVRASTIDFCIDQFVGSYYLWMCPFPNFVRSKFNNFLIKNKIYIKY